MISSQTCTSASFLSKTELDDSAVLHQIRLWIKQLGLRQLVLDVKLDTYVTDICCDNPYLYSGRLDLSLFPSEVVVLPVFLISDCSLRKDKSFPKTGKQNDLHCLHIKIWIKPSVISMTFL